MLFPISQICLYIQNYVFELGQPHGTRLDALNEVQPSYHSADNSLYLSGRGMEFLPRFTERGRCRGVGERGQETTM